MTWITYGLQTVDGDGNGGNGITPIMLASWSEFMIGEVELAAGNGAAAKNAMMDGISIIYRQSISFNRN